MNRAKYSYRQRILGFRFGFVALLSVSSIALVLGMGTPPINRLQLSLLNPESVVSYLRVGESLGFHAENEQDQIVAMQTLGLGIGLAARQGEHELAASMCIALAAIEPDRDRKTALWDMGLVLDPTRRQAWMLFRDQRSEKDIQINQDAARALYAARFNDPNRARELMGKKVIRDRIRDAARSVDLNPARVDQIITELINTSEKDECRGRVFIAQRSEGEMRRVVCPDHMTPIGSTMNFEDLSTLIKLELALLDDGASSGLSNRAPWEINVLLNLDEPASDPSVGQILEWYGADLTKPYRRGDRWVSSP
jgi:hypothetical protein